MDIATHLAGVHPYDTLTPEDLARVARVMRRCEWQAGEQIYTLGAPQEALHLIVDAAVEITDARGALVSLLGRGNSFGERGLLGDGLAATNARASRPGTTLALPADAFHQLITDEPTFARFFRRGRAAPPRETRIETLAVREIMSRDPVTASTETSIVAAARLMRDRHISCLGITDANRQLRGIVTTRDMTERVVAEGVDLARPVADIMTPDPITLTPSDLGRDVLKRMSDHHIGHLPVIEAGRLVGIVTQTGVTRLQATSSAGLLDDIAQAASGAEIGAATARIPDLLTQLVAAHQPHDTITRVITDLADATTRRLLVLAEADLGPPPAPYAWAACGSQGRREQTSRTDQDNVLILSDDARADDPYWAALAGFVTRGLDQAGYVFCPGEMMASTPRWCQPLRVWRGYFDDWITRPSPEAQMLASVMFDLRVVGGDPELLGDLQSETLAAASKNSIFVAHMVANSLKHRPPLNMLRGFATIRAGEHRHHIDLKMNGAVPVADLARVYAIQGQILAVNTRERIVEAGEQGVISRPGARDLVAAYDLIQTVRLETQAHLIASGRPPENYLSPSDLADFERSHLRDAFVVVRTMQAALGQGKGPLL